jgi:hypothetical protein
MNLDPYCKKCRRDLTGPGIIKRTGFISTYSQVAENKQKNPGQNFSDSQFPLPLPPL